MPHHIVCYILLHFRPPVNANGHCFKRRKPIQRLPCVRGAGTAQAVTEGLSEYVHCKSRWMLRRHSLRSPALRAASAVHAPVCALGCLYTRAALTCYKTLPHTTIKRPPAAPQSTAGVVVSYSLRSASMGFSFDAFTAGISPNTTPITMENATATAQAPTLMATGVPITELSI